VQLEQELVVLDHNRDSLVTIGVFDGVHLGHKYLISQLKELAKKQGLQAAVITFDKHPQEILNPGFHPLYLIDISEKEALLKNEGVDSVIILTFTEELANLSAKDFLSLLKMRIKMHGMVVGPDFAFGRNTEGNIKTIQRLSAEMDFSLTIVPHMMLENEIVSSTAIRYALINGKMDQVKKLLGRPFSLHGKVLHGQGRGINLGFPTLNLKPLSGQLLPPEGVYITKTIIDKKYYLSITNLGNNPTFGNPEPTVETFLLDVNGEFYNQEIKVEFLHKIRGEIKFKDTEDLKKQIAKDIEQTRIYFLNQK
jgi:riboflavin kinase/FMN adenylyltransferase